MARHIERNRNIHLFFCKKPIHIKTEYPIQRAIDLFCIIWQMFYNFQETKTLKDDNLGIRQISKKQRNKYYDTIRRRIPKHFGKYIFILYVSLRIHFSLFFPSKYESINQEMNDGLITYGCRKYILHLFHVFIFKENNFSKLASKLLYEFINIFILWKLLKMTCISKELI